MAGRALRIKTPLGGLYLSAPDRKLRLLADVTVRQSDGTIDRAQGSNIDYYYPHEMPILHKDFKPLTLSKSK